MSRLPILTYGDPCLTRVAQPVQAITPATHSLARDLIDTMYDAPGRGLAAPQVGESLRMFVVDCHWKDGAPRNPLVMINPAIQWSSGDPATHEEGCLSIPGIPMDITRPSGVRVRWTGLDGKSHTNAFGGIEAVCVQHEYDHLDGILIPDRLPERDRAEFEPLLNAIKDSGGTV